MTKLRIFRYKLTYFLGCLSGAYAVLAIGVKLNYPFIGLSIALLSLVDDYFLYKRIKLEYLGE